MKVNWTHISKVVDTVMDSLATRPFFLIGPDTRVQAFNENTGDGVKIPLQGMINYTSSSERARISTQGMEDESKGYVLVKSSLLQQHGLYLHGTLFIESGTHRLEFDSKEWLILEAVPAGPMDAEYALVKLYFTEP